MTPANLGASRVSSGLVASAAALHALSGRIAALLPAVAQAQSFVAAVRRASVLHRHEGETLGHHVSESAEAKRHARAVADCGRLLFDAELILANLLELHRWARGNQVVTESRSYNHKSPSSFASHHLRAEHLVGPYVYIEAQYCFNLHSS